MDNAASIDTPAPSAAAAPSAAVAPSAAATKCSRELDPSFDNYPDWKEDEIVGKIFPGGNFYMIRDEIERLRVELGLAPNALLTFVQVFSIRLFRMHIFYYFIYGVYDALFFAGFDPISYVDDLITSEAEQQLRTIEENGGMLPYFHEPFLNRLARLKNYCLSNNIKFGEMCSKCHGRY